MQQNFTRSSRRYLSKHFVYLLIVFLFFPPLSYATSNLSTNDIFKLSIEELATINIASKKNETVQQAPGIVTVITTDEIQRYGARNLRDILDRQTSLQVIGSNLFPHNRTTIRGAASTHQDNTVLLTINGRPIRDAAGISNRTDIYSMFPIDSIKQIEIIRGPGSVLYGTTAMTGVINIITKEASEQFQGSVSLGYGSFDRKQSQFTGSKTWKDLKVFTSINAVDSSGDDFNNITDELGTTGTYKTGKSGGQGFLSMDYKDFKLSVLLSDMEYDSARSTFALPSTDQQFERHYINLGHNYNFNDDWKLSTDLQYHHLAIIGKTSLTGNGNAQSQDYLAEATLFGKLNNRLDMLVGGTYNLREGSLLSGLNYSSSIASAYTQFSYTPLDWLKLVAGIEYNKPAETSGDLSSRFSALMALNNNWSVKVLYGEAFRSPTPIERFISAAPFLVGDPSLEPEKIQTFDAQLHYQTEKGSISATYFHSKQDNLITRSGTPSMFVNSGELTYDGFEMEGKYIIGKGFNFIGNMSYQTNEHDSSKDDETYAPDWMIKTGLSYESNRGYQFSLFNSFFAKSTLQNHQVATVTAANPIADGYNLLTANLNMNLGSYFNNAALSNTNLSLYGDNLLDEDIFFPSINRTKVNSIPHHAGRGFYGTISFNF
jgi:outer membrane receptor protein involved in Fe transport